MFLIISEIYLFLFRTHVIVGLFDPSHTLPDWGVGAMYKEVAEYTKEGSLWVRI